HPGLDAWPERARHLGAGEPAAARTLRADHPGAARVRERRAEHVADQAAAAPLAGLCGRHRSRARDHDHLAAPPDHLLPVLMRPARSTRVLLPVLGLLVLASAGAASPPRTDRSAKLDLIAKLRRGPEILILGDSRGRQAEPSVLQRLTGHTAFN